MKSILNKFSTGKEVLKEIDNSDVLDIIVKLTELPKNLKSAYQDVTTSYIAEFIYELASLYNKFYTNNNIQAEQNSDLKETFIALTRLAYNTLTNLLDILAIEIVDKM